MSSARLLEDESAINVRTCPARDRVPLVFTIMRRTNVASSHDSDSVIRSCCHLFQARSSIALGLTQASAHNACSDVFQPW